jgi:hypothetical protein
VIPGAVSFSCISWTIGSSRNGSAHCIFTSYLLPSVHLWHEARVMEKGCRCGAGRTLISTSLPECCQLPCLLKQLSTSGSSVPASCRADTTSSTSHLLSFTSMCTRHVVGEVQSRAVRGEEKDCGGNSTLFFPQRSCQRNGFLWSALLCWCWEGWGRQSETVLLTFAFQLFSFLCFTEVHSLTLAFWNSCTGVVICERLWHSCVCREIKLGSFILPFCWCHYSDVLIKGYFPLLF